EVVGGGDLGIAIAVGGQATPVPAGVAQRDLVDPGGRLHARDGAQRLQVTHLHALDVGDRPMRVEAHLEQVLLVHASRTGRHLQAVADDVQGVADDGQGQRYL